MRVKYTRDWNKIKKCLEIYIIYDRICVNEYYVKYFFFFSELNTNFSKWLDCNVYSRKEQKEKEGSSWKKDKNKSNKVSRNNQFKCYILTIFVNYLLLQYFE